MDTKGNRTRPVEIGLGHELGHAKHDNNGTNDKKSSGVMDPDGSGTILSKEELKARKEENLLRTEQGQTPRKVK